ncbi:MAG: hypothetical protein K0R54_610 [Clostridiaceae bacterium]|jgi:hypothetical protein|nr:hypothetical protein [Clostridiaceae bacterium]
MKTLAQLKRDAKAGLLEGQMVLRNGDSDIPDTLKGWRKIVDSNTVSITFLNNKNKKSALDIPCSSLIEYTDNELILYNPGLRELNEEEKTFLAKWEEEKKKTDYESRATVDLYTDGSSTYWQKKYYFIDNGFEYLLGHNTKQGKKYDGNTGMVYDNQIKGKKCMVYELRKAS